MNVQEIQQIIKNKIPDSLIIPEHSERGHFYRNTETGILAKSVTTKTGILDSPHLKKWAANEAVQYIDSKWEFLVDGSLDKKTVFKEAVLVHSDKFKDAGDIGTQGHKCIERYLDEWIEALKRPSDIRDFINGKDVRLWAITRSMEQFAIDYDIIPIASELKIFSNKYNYAGTLDSLMIVCFTIREGKPGLTENCQHDWWESKGKETYSCSNCDKKIKMKLCMVDFKTSNSIDKPEYSMQVVAYAEALKEMTGIRCEELLILQLDKDKMKYQLAKVINRPKAFSAFKHCCKVSDWLDGNNTNPVLLNKREKIKI